MLREHRGRRRARGRPARAPCSAIAAVVVTCFGDHGASAHGSTDEHDGRTEQVLATATSRAAALLASVGRWPSAGVGLAARRHRARDRASGWAATLGGAAARRPRPGAGRVAGARPSPCSWPPSAAAGRCSAGRCLGARSSWCGQLGDLLAAAAVGDRASRRTPTAPRCRPRPSRAGPALVLTALARRAARHRVVALPRAATSASVRAMWQPEPGWHPLPGGTGTSTVGVWRTVLGDRPVVVKRLARPGRARPGRAQRPAALRLLAPRRRRRHRRGVVDAHPGPARAPLDASVEEDVEGITLTQDVGRGRRQQRPVRRPRAGPVRRRRPRRRPAGWPATSCATGWRGSSAAAAGRRWPGRRSPTSPTTCGTAASGCSTQLDALPQVPQHGDPVPGQPARPRRATTWSPSTGRTLGHGPVGADLGYYRSPPARSSSRCSTPTCWGCPTASPPATRSRSAPG